jgi:DMSO/TMAO reductase YedYZ molybdopterin-dependent catalytic subunit
MNLEKRSPSILTGAFVGGLLTLPLMAVTYLGFVVAGLPFAPYDALFPFIRNRTPDEIITLTIDSIIRIIELLNLGRTDTAAKPIEQIMALLMLVGVGAVVGAVVFAIARRIKAGDRYLPGFLVGAVLGLLMVIFYTDSGIPATTSPTISNLWLFASFLAFALGINWIYNDLSDLPVHAPAGETTASVQPIDRRQFLVRVGGATATLTVLGAGLGALLTPRGTTRTTTSSAAAALVPEVTPEGTPVAGTTAGLEPAPGTRLEYTPLDEHYRIDISARPPILDASTWRLRVSGLVESPVEMTLDSLMNDYEPVDQIITLSCISNPIAGDLISTTRWTGVQLNLLLEEWNLLPEATHLRITSADGFDEYVALETIRNDDRILLAYAWDGQPLKQKHGFPLRIYIPNHYGMKQPKWITDIEVVDEWQEGYWVRRGWSESALVQTTSVIDTVATDAVYERDGQMVVPIGGIAYAGSRGISSVEVQIDDGEWEQAELRSPLSELTWVVWRYDWPFTDGGHTFRVRCVDGLGGPQTETVQGVRPDGATGLHQKIART